MATRVEVYENEKCCGNKGTAGRSFHSFEFSQSLSCVLIAKWTQEKKLFSISSRIHYEEKKGKSVIYFYYQNVNFLCWRRH